MKKNINLKLTVLFAMVAFFISCNSNQKVNTNADSANHQVDHLLNPNLSAGSYSSFEGFIPENGFISTEKIALRIAEVVLSNIYGKEKIEREKPFSINLENGIWLIEGYLEEGALGGVAYMEIRKSNGEILKVVHTK